MPTTLVHALAPHTEFKEEETLSEPNRPTLFAATSLAETYGTVTKTAQGDYWRPGALAIATIPIIVLPAVSLPKSSQVTNPLPWLLILSLAKCAFRGEGGSFSIQQIFLAILDGIFSSAKRRRSWF